MRGIAVVVLAVGACSFTPGALSPDAGPDGPPPVTVGFAKGTTLADEASNIVPIRVVLSAPWDVPITVGYAITGGTATLAVDYTGSDGTLTFAPGDVEEVIEVTVDPDGTEEPDETVELELQTVTGGAGLASVQHTLTIAANVLPRATFALASSMSSETMSPAIDITLDKAPLVQVTVDLVLDNTTTATAGDVDFGLSATSVTFAPGETTKQVTLNVANDTLDENDENVVIDLDNGVNVIIGTAATRTHQIVDNDDPPTVDFALASSQLAENGTGTDLVVSLSEASGRDITVEFAVDAASSAAGTDYAIPTATPLSFPAGMTTKIIRVNVTDDTDVETAETVVVTLGTLTNANAGTTLTHTLTITDNDSSCLGTGNYLACFAPPSMATDINTAGTINTDSDSRCSATAPAGWTGQPASCFIVATSISVSAATRVTGSKPLVLFATGNITVSANINASSMRTGDGLSGPGANSPLCTAYTDIPANASTNGAGGGGGGTFRSKGGNGGHGGVNTTTSGGSSPNAVGAPTVLRGGCIGQVGGQGTGGAGAGGGGNGGGVVYLVAGGTLSISSTISINVSGAGATTPGSRGGGGGGGSGGMLKLHAATISVSGARLVANGGGGSKGGDDNDPGAEGFDPDPATPTTTAAGGTTGNGGGDGGNGFAGTTQAAAGGNDTGSNAGGGGGGGGGHIEANLALTGATVSAGP